MAQVNGTSGDDSLIGTNGNDRIRGFDGNDDLFGLRGRDRLVAGAGDDWLVGGENNDTLDGTAGPLENADFDFDIAAYIDETGGGGVIVDLATGIATDTFGDTDTLIDIESVRSTLQNDTLLGSNAEFESFNPYGGDDFIDGRGGFDELRYDRGHLEGGTSGVTVDFATGTAIDMFGGTDVFLNIERVRGSIFNDDLHGDDGNNQFRAGTGRDFIDGRDGTDRVDFSRDDGGSGIWVNLNKGRAVDTGGDRDRLISIEDIRGTEQSDTITGDGADNDLRGLGGNDTIQGARGNDEVSGGTGDDRVLGGVGDDTVNGNEGADTLKGGSGADVFVIGHRDEVDRIVDFRSIDTLAIDSELVGLSPGDTLVDGEDFVVGFQNAAVVNRPTFILTPNNNLLFDADGNGAEAAVLFIRFVDAPQLSADDFFFF